MIKVKDSYPNEFSFQVTGLQVSLEKSGRLNLRGLHAV